MADDGDDEELDVEELDEQIFAAAGPMGRWELMQGLVTSMAAEAASALVAVLRDPTVDRADVEADLSHRLQDLYAMLATPCHPDYPGESAKLHYGWALAGVREVMVRILHDWPADG